MLYHFYSRAIKNAMYCTALACAWEKEAFTVTGISRSNVFIPARTGQLGLL